MPKLTIVAKNFRALEYLEWSQEQLPGEEMLVEFRHASWLEEENRAETLRFLDKHGMTDVVVDAPKTGGKNVLPTVVAATSETAYVRFHGRNAATWNKRTGSAAERFDYLYTDDELREFIPAVRSLASDADEAYVMFNNNGRSRAAGNGGTERDSWLSQAPTNALELKEILTGGS